MMGAKENQTAKGDIHMDRKPQKKKYQRLLCILLLAGSFFAALKCIFIGYQMDEGYAVAMSYRMLIGDKMISQIWDPHQTSAFFSAFLMWIYMSLFHTTAGTAIWLRICGTLIHGMLSYGIYRVVRRFLPADHSFYLGILYFNMLPKGYVTPEFSNLLIWFLTLLLLDLLCLEDRQKPIIAIRCGIWMCGMVLSYPSAVILFPFYLWYLWKQPEYGRKSALFFAGTCLIGAGAYLAALFSYMSPAQMFENLNYMLIGNSGHTEVSLPSRLAAYGMQFGQALLIGILCLFVSWLFIKLRRISLEDKKEYPALLMYLILMAAAVFPVVYWFFTPTNNDYFFIYTVYFILLIFAYYTVRELEEKNRKTISLWLVSSVLTFLAVLMLTDLTVFTSVRYILPGIIMGLAALLLYTEKHAPAVHRRYAKTLLLVFCFSSIFIKGWEYRGDQDVPQNITRVRGIISEGPAKGILAEYMQCAMHESLYAEMQEYVAPGDSVFLLESDATGYLFRDVNIASYTTISDPRYNDILLKYWELNPEKYPDVMIIPCWYGELHWDPESWIVTWTENEFDADEIIDGTYFRYYIKNS